VKEIFSELSWPKFYQCCGRIYRNKTSQNLRNIAKHFGFSYFKVDEEETLLRTLDNFFKPEEKPKILEINTSEIQNADVLKDYFNALK
jgi:2-succinyl-5-enolpyruvyl-6-hydroxy-3-cyclohexene-1-carboxylate synthase